MKLVAQNKKASFDYFIDDTLECGIVLTGTEIKSLRDNRVNLRDSWCNIVSGELLINGMHIGRYSQGNIWNHEETRVRKLLAHKKEIKKLELEVKADGYTLVPIKIYFNDRGKAKVLIGLCKGKHNYDKRQSIKEKDIERANRRNKEN